jgi:hypothetical protein
MTYISNDLKRGLQELLNLACVIVLIILSVIERPFSIHRTSPEDNPILHYKMETCRLDHFTHVCNTGVIHKSNSITGAIQF